ncbi:MAG: pyrroline-5-carboxylate reductase [Chloroflexi bacterium]|nr:pyrroline-5-carboxylate reductase [Chloroflexota bacterium]
MSDAPPGGAQAGAPAAFPSLVFVGAGQMAEAIIRGVLDAGLLTPGQIVASDVRLDRLADLHERIGIGTEARNAAVPERGQVIVLAVKPQDVDAALAEIGPSTPPDRLVISIAAGVPLARLEAPFTRDVPVIRVMPNTPCLVREGMAVLARGRYVTPAHEAVALRLFNATGKAVALPEKSLDAVTALSGSGPGYIAIVIEAMIDAGVRVGLPRDIATTLAIQTTLGTAAMLSQTGEHPARLKDMVTSPGGTTIAGIHALEKAGVRAAFMDAIVAATERSHELGQ